jgi:hypothetical protein
MSDNGYPDISDILRRKQQGRHDIAAKTFGEKIAMLEALRARLAPFASARQVSAKKSATKPRLSSSNSKVLR